jgi:hypothetical protein
VISDHCILRPGQPMRVFLTKADRDQVYYAALHAKDGRADTRELATEMAERERMLEVMDGN